MSSTEKIFILGKCNVAQKLDGTFKEISQLSTDVDIHNWVIDLFQNNEIDKIVIEIEDDLLLPLKIAYHIRLSIEILKEQSLIPILFLSRLSLDVIIIETEIYSQILATKGVFFSEINSELNNIEIKNLYGLRENEYLTKFLKIIHIHPDETMGRHSLANIWGAYIMDKTSNVNALSNDMEFKKELYFKYLSAFNLLNYLKPSPLKVIGRINPDPVNKIKASNKKILFIDDEADRGWDTVLRKIFKTSSSDDFIVISEKVSDFNSFSPTSKEIIETGDFDLYLLDLRLNGLDEEKILKVEEFSGMKVMQKIKSLNRGNQVIMFTASNKAWNLKTLFKEGVSGYYVKESPEYNFPLTFSEQNYKQFKNDVEKCFNRKSLREIWTHIKITKNESSNSDSDFISESEKALDIAWELINSSYWGFGFLTLFQCIELYANKVTIHNASSNVYEVDGTIVFKNLGDKETEWLLTYRQDKNIGYFSSEKSIEATNNMPNSLYKISCLLKLRYKKDDAFLKSFGNLNNLRNDIAHGRKKSTNITLENVIEILKILRDFRK